MVLADRGEAGIAYGIATYCKVLVAETVAIKEIMKYCSNKTTRILVAVAAGFVLPTISWPVELSEI